MYTFWCSPIEIWLRNVKIYKCDKLKMSSQDSYDRMVLYTRENVDNVWMAPKWNTFMKFIDIIMIANFVRNVKVSTRYCGTPLEGHEITTHYIKILKLYTYNDNIVNVNMNTTLTWIRKITGKEERKRIFFSLKN